MLDLQLKYWPDTILSQVAEAFTPAELSDSVYLKQISEAMITIMKRQDGIGIAGNQVGLLKRVLVLVDAQQTYITMFNPEIIEQSGFITFIEGCLSFPTIARLISRPNKVKVSYQDVDNINREIVLEDIQAVCIQHEIDHLNGITFHDKGISV